MDASHVNLNKVYSLVSAAGANQILNVSGDQKTLSLADGSSKLTPQQIEDNRKFHQGLLDSLTGITDDKAVQEEVRSKLGLSDGDKKVEPKSIFARDIKSVIDLVMSKVSKRIGEVLTRSFPAAVNELILEAVKANPKHDVVKAFLKEEGGTLNNLARLCRLTCQALKDGTNSAALAYLDGFAYDVADFKDVHWTNEEYDVGLNHRKEEEKALAEKAKPKEQPSVKNEPQPVKEENPVAENIQKNEVLQAPVQKMEQKEPQKHLRDDVISLKTAVINLYELSGKSGDVSVDLLTLIENEGETWLDSYNDNQAGIGGIDRTVVTDDEKLKILARAINNRWLSAKGKMDGVLEDAHYQYEHVVRFRTALADIKDTLETKKQEVQKLKACLSKTAKLDLLSEIDNLGKLDPGSGDVYDLMRTALSNAILERKGDDAVRKALKQELGTILNAGLKNFDVDDLTEKNPADLTVVYKEADIQKYKQPKLCQGDGTNLCYLRCIENGLIAGGKANNLPTLQGNLLSKKTYTFHVDIGDTKTQPVDLTVTKDEIDNVKTWYDANWKRYNGVKGNSNASRQVKYDPECVKYEGFAFYDMQKAGFTDLDWAVNIALAKRAMWKDAQKEWKGEGAVNAPSALEIENKYVGWTKLTGGYAEGYEKYLNDQLITQMGSDTDVAELFGLKRVVDFPVNHNITDEEVLLKNTEKVEQPSVKELFSQWSKVRQWKKEQPEGILTLNLAGKHFVSVHDFYYDGEKDFGFIVRDSNDNVAHEKKINVIGYGAEVKDDKTYCNTLHIHCFKPKA